MSDLPINRVYHPYWAWEDYTNGFYANPRNLLEELAASRDLLADPVRLESAMRDVTVAWSQSAEHQLSNREQNRRAWLGQAACKHAAGSSSLATRAAWPTLTDQAREAANASADRVIRWWEERNTTAVPLFDMEGLRHA